ncbi:MAG TPA: hypothetical protein VM778_10365 [Gemmatimonadota bacterium]|nr:hypothetical protein [Gemmatimonadota bacterium]
MSRTQPVPPESRAAAAAAYFLGFVTGAAILLRGPDDPYVRFHAWQSILFSAVVTIAILAMDFVPLLGQGLVLVFALAGIVAWVVLCVLAWRGRWVFLPLLGDIALERARAGGAPSGPRH